jgi:2-phosphosulfolactate phosphatase
VKIHVAFTPGEHTPGDTCIVVDVLRATSTIAQAIASGYTRVLCTAEIPHARKLAAAEGDAVLAGERRLERIDGFPLGNSPREVAGKPGAGTLVLTTTNGTRLLVAAAARYERVLVGSLLNLEAVAAAAREAVEVSVLCAGVLGELTLDDAYCAGRIVEAIGGEITDSASAAIRIAHSFADAADGLGRSRSGWNLRQHGLQADIDWCARESVLEVAPHVTRVLEHAVEIVV